MTDGHGDDGALTDRRAREDARRIADRFLSTHQDLLRHRTDRDGRWEAPGDLAGFGDGSALLAIIERQLLAPAREALALAEAEAGALREEIERHARRAAG